MNILFMGCKYKDLGITSVKKFPSQSYLIVNYIKSKYLDTIKVQNN